MHPLNHSKIETKFLYNKLLKKNRPTKKTGKGTYVHGANTKLTTKKLKDNVQIPMDQNHKKRRQTKKIKLYKCVQRIFERIKRQIISSQNIHVTELISRFSRLRAFILNWS